MLADNSGLKAVLFDLDGTLVSTKSTYRYEIVGNTLAQFGVTCSYTNIDKFWFEGDRDSLIVSVFRVEPSEFWRVYAGYDNAATRLAHTIIFDDVLGFLRTLREMKYQIGIVTNAPERIAAAEVGLIGDHWFDSVVVTHEHESIRPKPSPDGIIRCLSSLEIMPSEAIYIGNSQEDVHAAKAASVIDVLIDRNEHLPDPALCQPSFVIGCLNELLLPVRGR